MGTQSGPVNRTFSTLACSHDPEHRDSNRDEAAPSTQGRRCAAERRVESTRRNPARRRRHVPHVIVTDHRPPGQKSRGQ